MSILGYISRKEHEEKIARVRNEERRRRHEELELLKTTSGKQPMAREIVHLLSGEHIAFVYRVLHIVADIDFTDAIWWRTDGAYAPITFFVRCSDEFHLACADCEDLTPQNIEVFEQAVRDIRQTCSSSHDELLALMYAPTLFCARVRGMRPLKRAYPQNPNVAALLDACGPERI